MLRVLGRQVNDAYASKMKIALSNNSPERTDCRPAMKRVLDNSTCKISDFNSNNGFLTVRVSLHI